MVADIIQSVTICQYDELAQTVLCQVSKANKSRTLHQLVSNLLFRSNFFIKLATQTKE